MIIDLSKDGSVVAGGDVSSTEVFRWKLGTGLQVFNLAGTEILANDRPVLSENGSILVGRSATVEDRVFRWDAEAGTSILLPNGPANSITNVYPARPENGTVVPALAPSISGDGNTITGWANTFDGDANFFTNLWVFRWTQAGGTSDSPQADFSGSTFNPIAMAGNGTQIAGRLIDPVAFPLQEGAALWQPGMGTALVPSNQSRATAISYDGDVVAGARSDAGLNSRAWRWTQGTGVVDILNRFLPRAMSDDGSTIVGLKTDVVQPWIWDQTNGNESLFTYLGNNFGLTGFAASIGTPQALVSGDGDVLSVFATKWVAKVSPLQAVGLGDSYSSGEGAPAEDGNGYMPGTDTTTNKCHRSLSAYPALMRPRSSTASFRTIAVNMNVTGFTWDFIACSGAKTRNVLAGTETFETEPPQLSQGEVSADTDLVTISIGGNDAMFASVLDACIRRSNCFDRASPDGSPWKRHLPALISDPGGVRDRVRDVYLEIKSLAPNATVVALGYPRLVSGEECDDADYTVFGMSFNRELSETEQAWIRAMSDFLNEQLSMAAAEAGVHFVSVSKGFEGHNVCDTNPWVNGVVKEPLAHSFHPNRAGHEQYTMAVNDSLSKLPLDYSHGFFASGMPRNPPAVPR